MFTINAHCEQEQFTTHELNKDIDLNFPEF